MPQNPKKAFLFERTNVSERTRVALFQKWEREELMLNRATGNSSSEGMVLRGSILRKEQDAFFTPPAKETSVATPGAPTKQKKRVRKPSLKPKKLIYSDEDQESVQDSGITSDVSVGNWFQFKQSTVRRENRRPLVERGANAGDSLSANFEKIRLRSGDKENRNVVQRREKRSSDKPNPECRSYLGFDSECEELSRFGSELSWQDKLQWLQARRDVGLWIQCCRKTCKKWRFTDEYHDPIDTPKMWYCEMNADKSIASCDIPEKSKPQEIEDDLIENKYNAGSIVWGRVNGFPWWPGMIDDCPDALQYYELRGKSIKPVRYHVTFFMEPGIEHNWLMNQRIKPFIRHRYEDLVKKTTYNRRDYKPQLDVAYSTACVAVRMPIIERLQKFSFLARYTALHNNSSSNNNNNNSLESPDQIPMEVVSVTMRDSFDDEVPCSPKSSTHTTLRDYYKNVLLPRQRPESQGKNEEFRGFSSLEFDRGSTSANSYAPRFLTRHP